MIKQVMLLYGELTFKIRGVCFTVHNKLGPGLPERIYQRALKCELLKRKISFAEEKLIDIRYEGDKIGHYRVDFVID